MEKKISTVTGMIAAEVIGLASAHEHIHAPSPFRREMIQFQVQDLREARRLGLKTIVEVSPTRDIEALKEVSERSEVQIIPCTGHYVHFTEEEKAYSAEKFYAKWLDEIEHGIDGSGIRPSVIKVASRNPIPDPHETKILQAAGHLQRDTGLPVCVHSVTGCLSQPDTLLRLGALLLLDISYCNLTA